jgi:hypothetical protein
MENGTINIAGVTAGVTAGVATKKLSAALGQKEISGQLYSIEIN